MDGRGAALGYAIVCNMANILLAVARTDKLITVVVNWDGNYRKRTLAIRIPFLVSLKLFTCRPRHSAGTRLV